MKLLTRSRTARDRSSMSRRFSPPPGGRRASALILVQLLVLGVPLAAAAESSTVRLVSDAWPPFTGRQSESRVALDLVEEALKRAKVTTEFSVIDDFGVAIEGMREGSFDGSAAIWKSTERETYLTFSLPFLENQLVLVGREGSDVSAASLSDLSGKRLAVVASYDYGSELSGAAGVEVVQGQNDQENLGRLLAGEVDYMLVDDLLVQYARQNQAAKVEEKLEIGSSPLIRRPLHFALRSDLPDAKSIIDRFNVEIRKMMSDGTYNRVLGLSWIQVDVDGDGYLEYVLSQKGAGKSAPQSGYKAVLPESAGVPTGGDSAYWVDGQRYDTWSDIPDVYKIGDTLSGGPASPALSLFNLSF